MSDTTEPAEIDLDAIAATLGGVVYGEGIICPGPGHTAKDRSLRVWFDDKGDPRTHSFTDDDFAECRDYVREKLGLPRYGSAATPNHRPVVKAKRERKLTAEQERHIRLARTLWGEAVDPRGTLAERYLRERRKLDLPADLCGTVLRFHPRCVMGGGRSVPTLIALFRKIESNNPAAIHRIRLTAPRRGELRDEPVWEKYPTAKIERKMLAPAGGAAVKLRQPEHGKLVLAEGIETAMAAMELGLGPAWALGSVGGIAHFPVLPDVQHLILAEEAGKPSRDAVAKCSQRWRIAGRKVSIVTSDVGSDLNDAIIAKKELGV
jgi:hypothetical protein